MEFLNVLVVLVVVFQGSLSLPSSSEDELRVIVGKLETLVASLRQYVSDDSMPEYYMQGLGPMRELAPELPIPSTRSQLYPRGLYDDEHDPSTPTYKQLYEVFEKILEPYFSRFPNGPYSAEMPVTPRDYVALLSAWYKKDNKAIFEEQTFYNVGKELLGARLQCATTKLNQIVFNVLKDQARAMAEDDQDMNKRVRKILENWIKDTTTVDKVAQKIVMAAHRHTYGEIMNYIKYFQFKDVMEFLTNVKNLLRTAQQNKWSPVGFDEKLNQLFVENVFNKCPSRNHLRQFHQEMANRFQEELFNTQSLKLMEAWLRTFLPTYMTTDATPAINAILLACTDYVKSAMFHFKEVEDHVISRNQADISNFMSKFLSPHQLEYLQSIFEFLSTTNTSDMRVQQMDKEIVRS